MACAKEGLMSLDPGEETTYPLIALRLSDFRLIRSLIFDSSQPLKGRCRKVGVSRQGYGCSHASQIALACWLFLGLPDCLCSCSSQNDDATVNCTSTSLPLCHSGCSPLCVRILMA